MTRDAAVVMDKPIAADATAAAQPVEDFATAGVPFTVFQNRRRGGDLLTVWRVVQSGELGEITRLESGYERFGPRVSEGGWREARVVGCEEVDPSTHRSGPQLDPPREVGT